MTEQISLSTGDIVYLLLITVAILGSGALLRAAVQRIPALPRVQAALASLVPLVEVALGGLWIVLMVQRVFRPSPIFGGVAMVGVLLYALWLGREPVRDTLAGVILRTGGAVRVGDNLFVDGIEGRVQALGPRLATLQLRNGDESLVPYTKLSGAAIVRTPLVFGAHRHTFRLPPETDANSVVRAALLCHWSSVARIPVLDLREGGLFVTVFALEPSKGAAVEAFVRTRVRNRAATAATAATAGNRGQPPRVLDPNN